MRDTHNREKRHGHHRHTLQSQLFCGRDGVGHHEETATTLAGGTKLSETPSSTMNRTGTIYNVLCHMHQARYQRLHSKCKEAADCTIGNNWGCPAHRATAIRGPDNIKSSVVMLVKHPIFVDFCSSSLSREMAAANALHMASR